MNVVITLAGHSKRFKDVGYTIPKAFIKIDGKMMIEYVCEMFSPQDYFYFIINTEQEKLFPILIQSLKQLVPHCEIIAINPHNLGPIESVLCLDNKIPDEPFIISYCDFFVKWNYKNFLRNSHGFSASLSSFKGFHPASFGDTYYAYMKTDDKNQLIELQEKKSFIRIYMLYRTKVGRA